MTEDSNARAAFRTPTVYVTDAAAESARIVDTLRSAGYSVADVPLSMLVSRAQVQRPNVVLVDVDAGPALEEIARVRRLPGGGAIDFIYFGSGAGSIRSIDDAIANEGSAFFARPIDVGALVRRLESLTGGPSMRPDARPSTPPPSIAQSSKTASARGSAPPDKGSTPSLPAPGARDQGPPLPMSTPSLADLVEQPRSLATFGTVSNELQQLLADAEMRAEIAPHPDGPIPSPEEEIETVLPADVLASLDEPIESDEDEENEPRGGTGADHLGAHAKGTTAGGSRLGTGSGRPATTPHTFERRVQTDRPNVGVRRITEERPETGAGTGQTDRRPLSTAEPSPPRSPNKIARPTLQSEQATEFAPTSVGKRFESVRIEASPAPPPVASPAPPPVASPAPPPVFAAPPVPSLQLPEPVPESLGKIDSVTIATVDLANAAGSPSLDAVTHRLPGVVLLRAADSRRYIGDAIARRLSGALCFEHDRVVRRLVLREGDLVTAASGAETESLVSFLGARGELPKTELDRLSAKIPPYGRHAGAALVAHGFLGQDQLWTVLRSHAEWIATNVLRLGGGTAQLEVEPPGRLRAEPSVFAASTGPEIFVELVRRAVAPEEAIEALGGDASRVGDGANTALLGECSLPPADLELVSRARGGTVGDVLLRAPDAEIASVIHALALLGVLEILPAAEPSRAPLNTSADLEAAALEEEAVRARIRARLELVDEGDYFAVLGVPRDATSYEVRRAFIELRRAFEPSQILSPRLHNLADDVRKIVLVLEEAYEILRDQARRERYRRAIEARPA